MLNIKNLDDNECCERHRVGVSVSSYENTEKDPIFVSKNAFKEHADLLLVVEKGTIFLSILM